MGLHHRPESLKWANVIVRGLDRLKGSRLFALEEEALIREAVQETGLHDLGDEAFLEPLRILCEGSRTGRPLSAFGRLCLRSDILTRLKNRLKIEGDLWLHPEILEEEIEAPIFILGLPETGMTLLHRLLALDPSNRTPRLWETFEPSPPPHRISYRTDPRIARTAKKLKIVDHAIPKLRTLYELDAELPEECIALMANDLVSWWFALLLDDGYVHWLDEQDLTRAYRLHRRQLQLLQWHCRADRWVLKSPWHLHGLEWLLRVYPDARIIMTHRDPLEAMTSYTGLVTTLRAAFYGSAESCEIARWLAEEVSEWVDGAMQIRRATETNGQGIAFMDVLYTDLTVNPLTTIERIYEWLGLELTRAVRKRIQVHLRNHPGRRRRRRGHSREPFGLEDLEAQRTLRPEKV
jgi:hypothetical protein